MQKLIFSPTFGNQPDKVIGRQRELGVLREALSSAPGDPRRALLIIGRRGMGKTALLLEARDLARQSDFIPVKVTNSAVMLGEIVDSLRAELQQQAPRGRQRAGKDAPPHRLSGLGISIMGTGIDVSFAYGNGESMGFRRMLGLLCVRAQELGKGVMLLVDEVQPDSEELMLLAKTFQELVGESKNIAIVMAGLHSSISHILNERTLTFLNRARRLEIGTVGIGSVALYYRAVFKKLGYGLSDDQIEQLAAATRGFPYLLQLVGYNLVETFGEDDEIGSAQIGAIIRMSLENMAETIFEPALKPLTPTDRKMLAAVADVADDGRARIADVVARVNGENPTKGNAAFQRYRKKLIDYGVLSAPQRGIVQFDIPYLAEYVRRR